MTQTHLRWIRMALPVDAHWKNFLIREVHPLLQSADNTGAINQWYFKWSYRRGQVLDVFIEADSTAVHTILRPMLNERFGSVNHLTHPSPLLQALNPAFEVRPADIEEDELNDLHVVSTQLMASHGLHASNSLLACSTEVYTALLGLNRGLEWVSAFAKTQLGNWLDQYLHNRFTSQQTTERQKQEVELLAFLRQRTSIAKFSLLHPKKIAWIEGFQDISILYDGDALIAEALNDHILRYDLASFEIGQLWLEIIGEDSSYGEAPTQFGNESYQY